MTLIQQLLCKYFCEKTEKTETLNPFTILRHRSGQHIRTLLQKQFPNAYIRIPDINLSEPTRREFDVWLQGDQVSTRTYHPEWYDCDDFARALRCKIFKIGQSYKTTLTVAYCEGYTGKDYHAYNMLIDSMNAIYIIEPQNDRVVPIAESNYRTDFIQL